MPVTNYHTINGRLIGETTGGVRTDYVTDALGNIPATMDQTQCPSPDRYKPHGGLLAKCCVASRKFGRLALVVVAASLLLTLGCEPLPEAEEVAAVKTTDLGFVAGDVRTVTLPDLMTVDALVSEGHRVWAYGNKGIVKVDLRTMRVDLVLATLMNVCYGLTSPSPGVLIASLSNGELLKIDAETGKYEILPEPSPDIEAPARVPIATLRLGEVLYWEPEQYDSSSSSKSIARRLLVHNIATGSRSELKLDVAGKTMMRIYAHPKSSVIVFLTFQDLVNGELLYDAIAYDVNTHKELWRHRVGGLQASSSPAGNIAFLDYWGWKVFGSDGVEILSGKEPKGIDSIAWYDEDHIVLIGVKATVVNIRSGLRQILVDFEERVVHENKDHAVWNAETGNVVFSIGTKELGVIPLSRVPKVYC